MSHESHEQGQAAVIPVKPSPDDPARPIPLLRHALDVAERLGLEPISIAFAYSMAAPGLYPTVLVPWGALHDVFPEALHYAGTAPSTSHVVFAEVVADGVRFTSNNLREA